jgi:hypothetical protein
MERDDVSHSSILFRWLGINWTMNECMVALGALLMLVASGLFIVLFRHVKGKVQRMSREETWDLLMNAGKVGTERRTVPVWGGPAVGVELKLNCNIDTLRQAARRGDWLTFWLWPLMLSGWFTGMWLVFLAIIPRQPLLLVLITLVPALVISIAWFMPWAALYTNIDLNADVEPPAPTSDQPRSSKI